MAIFNEKTNKCPFYPFSIARVNYVKLPEGSNISHEPAHDYLVDFPTKNGDSPVRYRRYVTHIGDLPIWARLMCGGMAGLMAQGASYPLHAPGFDWQRKFFGIIYPLVN
jgi:hypothetical protein